MELLPFPVVELAPRRLVEQEDVGAVEPRLRHDEAHDGTRVGGRQRRRGDGDGAGFRKKQAHAQALVSARHGLAERCPHGGLVARKAEVAGRGLKPVDVALKKRKTALGLIEHGLDELERLHRVGEELHLQQALGVLAWSLRIEDDARADAHLPG